MIKAINYLSNYTFLGELIRRKQRRQRANSYFKDQLESARAWSRKHTEFSNFYYDLTEKNRMELASLIAFIFGISPHGVLELFKEVDSDIVLRTTLEEFKERNPELRDSTMKVGRRLGWYAIARVMKPAVIVETGVHHGVGALVLNRALERNRLEGNEGRYFGTDINPEAGILIRNLYSKKCVVLCGDSIESLRGFSEQMIDLFINDSDHSTEYELQEYLEVQSKLTERAVVLGDNSHTSDSLLRFSNGRNRPFIFFAEEPSSHWYPGAGIGISLPSKGHPFPKFG